MLVRLQCNAFSLGVVNTGLIWFIHITSIAYISNTHEWHYFNIEFKRKLGKGKFAARTAVHFTVFYFTKRVFTGFLTIYWSVHMICWYVPTIFWSYPIDFWFVPIIYWYFLIGYQYNWNKNWWEPTSKSWETLYWKPISMFNTPMMFSLNVVPYSANCDALKTTTNR